MTCVKGGICSLLVDSGASVSVLKIGIMVRGILVDSGDILKLTGVTTGKFLTMGRVEVDMNLGDALIFQKFHLVSDDFGINVMGILGRDFLEKYKAKIDFGEKRVILNTNEESLGVDFYRNSGVINCSKVQHIKNLNNNSLLNKVRKLEEEIISIKNNVLSQGDLLSNFIKSMDLNNKLVKNVNKEKKKRVRFKMDDEICNMIEDNICNKNVKNVKNNLAIEELNQNRKDDQVISSDKFNVNVQVNEISEDFYVEINDNKVFLNCKKTINIPMCSERCLKFKFDFIDEYICEEEEITDGIFVGSSIVAKDDYGFGTVCVTNFNNKEGLIENFRILLLNKYEYDVFLFDDECMLDRNESLLRELKLNHLRQDMLGELEKICINNSNIFFLKGDKLKCTYAVEHEIPLTNNRPIYVKQYRLPQAQKEIMNEKITEMLDSEIIRPSHSPYNFPTILVAKKSENGEKKWRMVVDYRKLNEISIPDSFPLPNIIDILDQLGGAVYFSTLDLASGYHQLLVKEEDRCKTAFSTSSGHYEYIRLPMGLMNSGRTFQRLMNQILSKEIGKSCFVYLDDIVVYGRTLEEHNIRLNNIFKTLGAYDLRLQTEKCKLLKTEVVYLGHLITSKGILPDPSKTECVKNFPIPRKTRDIKSFLGLVGYYRRFIQNFAEIAKPLTKQLRKEVRFKWDDNCQKAFEIFREKLISPPILQFPNFSREFIITTDASTFALGAVLSQGKVGQDLPVAFASRTMIDAETRYTTTEQEMLAVVWGIQQFRTYVWGQKFKIITDHQPLTWIFSVKDPSSRLMRWRIKLEEYQYEVVYKKGKLNMNADALSRIETNLENIAVVTRSMNKQNMTNNSLNEIQIESENNDQNDETSDVNLEEEREIRKTVSKHVIEVRYYNDKQIVKNRMRLVEPDVNVIRMSEDFDENEYVTGNVIRHIGKMCNNFYLVVKNELTSDIDVHGLIDALEILKEMLIEMNVSEIGMIMNRDEFENLNYDSVKKIIDNCFSGENIMVLMYIREIKILKSDEDINRVLELLHSSKIGGHVGINRLEKKIRQRYDFPNIKEKVKSFVEKCQFCQKNKCVVKTRMPMEVTSTSKVPFERVALDIVGPLPESGEEKFKYLLTFQDDITKYVEAIPLVNQEAETIARAFVKNIILRHSSPRSILTDNGSNFVSELFKNVCKILGIKRHLATPYHPETNGALERTHRTFKEFLRSYVNDSFDNWDEMIQYGVFVFNTTPHTATKYSPFELLYGFKAELPNVLKGKPQIVYNYDNYLYELKFRLQKSHEIARQNLIRAKEKSKVQYDKKINPKTFIVGQKVYLENMASAGVGRKLKSLYVGPYEVTNVPSRTNTEIMIRGKKKIYHNNLLKLANE